MANTIDKVRIIIVGDSGKYNKLKIKKRAKPNSLQNL